PLRHLSRADALDQVVLRLDPADLRHLAVLAEDLELRARHLQPAVAALLDIALEREAHALFQGPGDEVLVEPNEVEGCAAVVDQRRLGDELQPRPGAEGPPRGDASEPADD